MERLISRPFIWFSGDTLLLRSIMSLRWLRNFLLIIIDIIWCSYLWNLFLFNLLDGHALSGIIISIFIATYLVYILIRRSLLIILFLLWKLWITHVWSNLALNLNILISWAYNDWITLSIIGSSLSIFFSTRRLLLRLR